MAVLEAGSVLAEGVLVVAPGALLHAGRARRRRARVGHHGAALRAALVAQRGHRRLHRPAALRRGVGRAGGGDRRHQPAARAHGARSGAGEPVQPVEPPVPQPALPRRRGDRGLRRARRDRSRIHQPLARAVRGAARGRDGGLPARGGRQARALRDALRALSCAGTSSPAAPARGSSTSSARCAARRCAAMRCTTRCRSTSRATRVWAGMWPEAYRDPDGEAVRRFAREHAERVESCTSTCSGRRSAARPRRRSAAAALGMAVGLYLDLAVSVDRAGSDAWAHAARLRARRERRRAAGRLQPPGTGLGPAAAATRSACARRPTRRFVATLRASMLHAGALRIDHVMGLMRLFWMPRRRGRRASGAYVHYPLEDMLGDPRAGEPAQQRCLVIGEDLGTVPDEMRAALAQRRRALVPAALFERDAGGGSSRRRPTRAEALVAVSHPRPADLRRLVERAPTSHRAAPGPARRGGPARAARGARRRPRAPSSRRSPASGLARRRRARGAAHAGARRGRARLRRRARRRAVMMVQMEDVLERARAGQPARHDRRAPELAAQAAAARSRPWARDPRFAAHRAARWRALRARSRARRERRAGPGARARAARDLPAAAATATSPSATRPPCCRTSPGSASATSTARRYLRARPGSTHGYDIVDHDQINPEIGARADFERFVAALRAHGMGQLLDIVPNHMGVLGADNAWWMDVLENGPASAYARLSSTSTGTRSIPSTSRQRCCCRCWATTTAWCSSAASSSSASSPTTGSLRGALLRSTASRSTRASTRASSPRGARAGVPRRRRGAPGAGPRSIMETFARLPRRGERARARSDERHAAQGDRQGAARLARALAARGGARDRAFGGRAERPARGAHQLRRAARAARGAGLPPRVLARGLRRDQLPALLRHQRPRRAAAWRTRRCSRPRTRLVLALVADGAVDGLRIDHPDGLYDPAVFRAPAAGLRARRGLALPTRSRASARRGRSYVVAEKIAAPHEHVPESWAVHGTTGYRFATWSTACSSTRPAAARLEPHLARTSSATTDELRGARLPRQAHASCAARSPPS